MLVNILEFKTENLITSIQKHHDIYDFPIKDIAAENILVNYFKANNQQVIWDIGSHKPGSDIFIVGENKGYSIKSAKQPLTGKYLQVSSFRTSSHSTLELKKQAINKFEETIAFYIVFARTESKANKTLTIHYYLYLINPEIFNINSFTFEKSNNDYVGINNLGIKIGIVEKMSGQVWYSLPMDLIRQSSFVSKICESGPYVRNFGEIQELKFTEMNSMALKLAA